MEKSWKFQGGGGSNAKPSGTENPVGWGVKLEKTLRGEGMDIVWNHTLGFYGSLRTKIVEIVDNAHKIFKEPSGIFRGSYYFSQFF